METYNSEHTGATIDEQINEAKKVEKLTLKVNDKAEKRPGKNLFNKNSRYHIYGQYISKTNQIFDNELYLITEYIRVKPNTAYCFRLANEGVGCAMYDNDYNFLKVVPMTNFTTTSETRYVRFSQLVNRIDSQQLEEGSAYTSYEDYTDFEIVIDDNSVDTKKIADKAVTLAKLDFNITGKNLIDPNDTNVRMGYYVSNGLVLENASYNTTGYIPVIAGKEYALSYKGTTATARFIDYYDSSYKAVSTGANVSTFIVPDGVAYVRLSIAVSSWTYIQFELGSAPSAYEPFQYYIDGECVKDVNVGPNKVGASQIIDKSVSPNKTSFFKMGKNLVDISSNNVLYGKYISSDGNIYDNSTYNTTDYIPVVVGKTYRIGASDKEASSARIIATYDSNYKFTSNFYTNTDTITIPEGVSYIRASLYVTAWDYAQISEGESKIPYSSFAVIKNEYLPNTATGATDVVMYVPKDIYVAAGRTIELYYEQIVLNAHRYNIQATCSVGKALDRKFQIIGDASKVGDYQLNINVYNDSGVLVGSDYGTIHIVSNNLSKTVNVVPFGDSLTNDKPWLGEMGTLSANKIKMVGTRHNQHEGRSGASVSLYLNKTGNLLYTYDNFYSGVGLDAPIFSETTSYSKGDMVRRAATFGTGASGYHVYVFKTSHYGAWSDSNVACISGGNPLYDYNNNRISLGFYKTLQGLSVDAIIIYLGTNGINLSPETNMNGALGIKTLIDEIRQEDATTPIIVVNTIFRSSQNGIGNQGNTDGYKAQAAYKFEEDRKVLLLAKSLGEMLNGYDRVYIAPVGFTHDSKYNFGNTKVAVNPRLEVTETVYELMPSDSVHPLNSGYYQMADTIYSTICAIQD